MPTKHVCMPAVGVVLDVHCMSSSPSKIPQQAHHQAKADKDKGLLRIRSEPYAPSLCLSLSALDLPRLSFLFIFILRSQGSSPVVGWGEMSGVHTLPSRKPTRAF